MSLTQYDPLFLRLLKHGPFERRQRGGWRFGTKRISDAVADRLIASGRVRTDGLRIWLGTEEPAE